MAKTVDDKVVAMSFENSKFESGVRSTLSGLDKLKKALKFDNAGKGLDNINKAAQRTDFSHMSQGLDTLKSKFGALRVTGIAVMASIATQAVSAGSRLVKSFTFQPVMDGLHEYQTNLNSVQTILANTQASGAKLKDVNGALQQLNTYSDKTIYNFGEMAKNIGTFTAAGVDLKTSVASIKGIANLAALSGSNSQQASTAMYQLSQAIAAGKVGLQDWNSVVNAGMGGSVFQRALAQTAEQMGTIKKGALQLKGPMKNVTVGGQSFRESIMAKPGEKSWLTSDVLTKTLKHFTGDMTDAQLKAEGFTESQIKAIQAQAKTAQEAATKVKTLGQVFDIAKETMGSGWAQTFQTILGDFGESRKTFTAMSNAINGFINASAQARNKVLGDWKALGGRKILIDSLKQAFHDLAAVVKPIKDAFRDVFPAKTGKDLFNLTQRFANFTKALTPSADTIRNLHKTFRGFFAILDIGKMVIGGLFNVIAKLFGAVGSGSGGVLKLTGSWGDWVYALDQSLKKTGAINKFFGRLGTILQTPILLLKQLAHAIASAFGGDTIGKASQAMGPLEKVIDGLTRAWDKFLGSVGSSREIVKPALDGISQMFGAIGQTIADALKGANFDAVFKVIQVGLLGGIFLTLKKSLSGGLGNALAGGVLKSVVQAFTGVGSLTKSIGGTFNALTGSIQTMQQNVKSDTLKNIAISIALLSASMVGLSLVDPKRLNGALTAITIGFGQLLGAMAIMDKIGKSGGFIKMPVIAASMVILATAIDLLAIAVMTMSKLSMGELAKGLGAVTVLLAGLSAASVPLSANAAGMIRAGTGITIIAVAMNILARAVKSFGSMDMKTLEKGIGGIAVSLAGIGAASRLFPTGMVAIGVGLIAVGTGLKIITGSIVKLGGLDIKVLAKGIGAVAIALAGIGLAMRAMPGPGMLITAAGLVLVAVALKGISKAITTFGGMSIKEIAKGLITLAAALGILTIALYAMSGTLAGSAALAVAAAGLALLAPALKALGDQSWTQIIKGIVALAAAFGLLGVAGLLLAPVAPAILALGAALIAVGAGLALAGAGVALIGIGLASIAVAGPAAVKILVDALVKLAESLPIVIKNLVKALVQLVTSVADAAPKFVQAMGKILVALAKAIVAATPQLTKAFTAILQLIFKVLRDNFPGLVKTGFDMLKALLKGIANNIGQVVKMVVNIIAKFIGAIASSAGKLVAGGLTILLAILKGIGSGLGKVVTTVATIITKFIGAIASGLSKIGRAGLSILTRLLKAISDNLGKVISAGTSIITKLVKGIGNAATKIATSAISTVAHFISVMASEIPKRVNQVATAVIKMLNRMASVIRQREPEFIAAMGNIGSAIAGGIVSGLSGLGGKLAKKIGDEVKSMPKKALGALGKLVGAAVHLPLPDGLVQRFGVRLTDQVAELLGYFDDNFQKQLAKIGGSDNIEFLWNLGAGLSGSFMDGLLSGMERVPTDPMAQARMDLADQLAASRADVEKIMLDSTNKIRAAQAALDRDNEAKDNAKRIKDKKRRAERVDELNKDIADQKKIRTEEGKRLAQQEQLLVALKDASKFINTDPSYDLQITKLRDAKQKVADLNAELEKQTGILDDLKSKRQSLFDQTFDQFTTLPGLVAEDADGNKIKPEDQVNNYIASLSGADDAVGVFTNSLDQLQGMGLNADTYKQLLDAGPAAQGFVTALINAGPGAVGAINAADTDLRNAAGTLADHAASSMYDAGIKTAEGLIKGLNVSIPEAVTAAEDIAKAIIKAIRRRLRIKSPSQVFAEIGAYTIQGMAEGISNSSKTVTDALGGVSDDALSAMKSSLQKVTALVEEHIDPNPTITPVLDLSEVQNGAQTLGSLLNVVPISAAASFGQASSISTDQQSAEEAAASEASVIKFEQNNYSPESLTPIEIYRQTRNQLSQAKQVLAT